jgi:hypothetical protein
LEKKEMKKYEFKVGGAVSVYEDVMTQHVFEGVAKIVKIHKLSKNVVDCDVRFYRDMLGSTSEMKKEICRRKIKR